jgi:hypothetical protein
MAPPSDDDQIKAGLKYLGKADRHALKAALALDSLFGGNLSATLHIGPHHFDVTTGPGRTKRYRGHMTKGQAAILNLPHNKQSQAAFAAAIYHVLCRLDHRSTKAIEALLEGLVAPGTYYPILGTCVYDTGAVEYEVSQTTCKEGLLGTWTATFKTT